MKIKIKEKILQEIGEFADNNSFQVYLVGGFVRDYILGRERTDYDLTILGDPIEFATKLGKKFNSRVIIYERFRTALVPIGEYKIEIVGTRKESYLPDSRNPIVVEGTLEDDIRRRDFTVNTLVASLNKNSFGEIIDLYDGLNHINQRLLITPLDPETTFNDDPLRMLRAARFSAQLDFNIDYNVILSIKKFAKRIKIISQERITEEFIKILSSDNPVKGLIILHKTGLLNYIFPELANLSGIEKREVDGKVYSHKDVFKHTLQVLNNILDDSRNNVWLRFAVLMHDIAKPKTKRFVNGIGWTFHGHEEVGALWQKRIFKRMKLPFDKLQYVEKLVRLHQRPMIMIDEEVTDSAIRRLAVKAGNDLEDLFKLCKADITTQSKDKKKEYLKNYEKVAKKIIEVQEKDKLREFKSPIDGNEIMMHLKIKPSKLIGLIKNEIEEAILEGIIPNEYEAAKKYFLNNCEKWKNQYSGYL